MDRRRTLRGLLLLASHTFALPILALYRVAHAGRVVRVAVVNPHAATSAPPGTGAFKERLRELGYIEGKNLLLDSRWADGRPERLPDLVASAIEHKPDVLVTWGAVANRAARKATDTIPIVGVGDLLGAGLVSNLAKPGGNLTGVSLGFSNISDKWLELLKEMVPRLSTVGVIANPDNPLTRRLLDELEVSAPAQRVKLLVLEARSPQQLDGVYREARDQMQAVLVLPDPFVYAEPQRLLALAAKYRLPSIYSARGTVAAGGLISYGPSFAVIWRRAADYVDRILNSAKPSDLPIEEPTQYELVVNLKAAKELGIAIPQSVLGRADEVIR
jgi:putative ABC transport system substrate-binding protein